MSTQPESNELKPGADRFWGQFSQSKAGRSRSDDESNPDGQSSGDAGSGQTGHSENCLEWCPICRSAELFRTAVSPELRQQAESIQHEAMGVLKAFLDAYTEKSTTEAGASATDDPADDRNQNPEPEPRVKDIPLE